MKTKNERRYCVYMLRFSATGEPFYIGKGELKRPKVHYQLSSLRENNPKNYIINNFDTYYTVEREGLTNDEANAYEKELIALWGFENLTNLTRGGSGTDGCIPSVEKRAKLSECWTDERKAEQSEAYSGDKNPMFGRTGEKNPFYGRTHTEETRAKQSEAMTGKYSGENHPNYDATVYAFQHKDGRIETCTQYELRMKYNLNQSSLSEVVNGKRPSTGGWSLFLNCEVIWNLA